MKLTTRHEGTVEYKNRVRKVRMKKALANKTKKKQRKQRRQ